MRDEFFDRDYQAGRDALHDGIDNLIGKAMQAFRLLNEFQFEAPWNGNSGRGGGSASVH